MLKHCHGTVVVLEQKSRQAELGAFERGEKKTKLGLAILLSGHTQFAQGIVAGGREERKKQTNKHTTFRFIQRFQTLILPFLAQEVTACLCMSGPSWKGCTSAH